MNQEIGVKAMEQVLKDQSLLAQQIAATGKVVVHLTLEREAEVEMDVISQDSMDGRPPQHHRPPFRFLIHTTMRQLLPAQSMVVLEVLERGHNPEFFFFWVEEQQAYRGSMLKLFFS